MEASSALTAIALAILPNAAAPAIFLWRHPKVIKFWTPLQLFLPGTLVTPIEDSWTHPLPLIDSAARRKVPEHFGVFVVVGVTLLAFEFPVPAVPGDSSGHCDGGLLEAGAAFFFFLVVVGVLSSITIFLGTVCVLCAAVVLVEVAFFAWFSSATAD